MPQLVTQPIIYIPLLSRLMYAIIIGGFIIIVICNGTTDAINLKVLHGSYSTILIALSIMFAISWGNNYNSGVGNIFKITMMFLNICAVLIALILIIHYYYDNIVGGHVSDYYSSFSNTSTLILAVQLFFLHYTFKDNLMIDASASVNKNLSIIS